MNRIARRAGVFPSPMAKSYNAGRGGRNSFTAPQCLTQLAYAAVIDKNARGIV
jgi:hypothetical protein